MAQGSVARFDADRGFGFVTPDDGGPDLFVHVSAVPGTAPLEVGQRVEYDAEKSKRGLQATRIRLLSGSRPAAARGPRRPPAKGPVELVEGTVSWFDTERGFGFLLPADGGADVFVHATEVAGGATLVPGQPVQFEVTGGPRGPQARRVIGLGSVTSAGTSAGTGGASAAEPGPRAPDPARRAVGTLSWLDADKGFGFLTPDDGAGDVFVHVSQIAEDGAWIDPGERVEYELVQGERGRQAKAVRRASGARAGEAPDAGPRRSAGAFGRVLGTVSWFDAVKGYGFVAPDDGSGDVYVRASSLAGGLRSLDAGQRVDLEVVPGPRGRNGEDVRPA